MKRHLLVLVAVSVFGLPSGAFAEGKGANKPLKGDVMALPGADKVDAKGSFTAPNPDPKMSQDPEAANKKHESVHGAVSLPVALDVLEHSRSSGNKAGEVAIAEALRPRDPQEHDFKAAIREAEAMAEDAKKQGNIKEQKIAERELSSLKQALKELKKNNPKTDIKSAKVQECSLCALQSLKSGQPASAKDFAEAQNVVNQRIDQLKELSKKPNAPKSILDKMVEYDALSVILKEKAAQNVGKVDPNSAVKKSQMLTGEQAIPNPYAQEVLGKKLSEPKKLPGDPAIQESDLPTKAGTALDGKL